ncbi:DUF6607 family protein, partial [Enterococcus faecium]|uniref:DUF6607 family protein n=1 Tax=Enterococcus faecium TaxID=1352 RepID=UPI003D9FFCA5
MHSTMKRLLFLLCLLTTTIISQAQSKQEQGAIKSLCGCYDVKFMYAEIFPSDTASKFTKPY